jgi:DHA2 family multidrug resistance protein
MASDPQTPQPPINRPMILASMLLSTTMTALDSTIANVALPHIAGSVDASSDQVTWVLTSYIIAAAIMTPTSGWLAGRFGHKRTFITAIIGFTIASALCGAAQSLSEIVLFRFLQGLFGALMMPLSQSALLAIFPGPSRGPIMAAWGSAAMVAPIAGPVLGGFLTDAFSWRSVFYINLPIGVLCSLGMFTFFPDRRPSGRTRFDSLGFLLLAVTLTAYQLMVDRGQTNDWFSSPEIRAEAFIAGLALILFLVHATTFDDPFVPLVLFTDRNFVSAILLIGALSILVFSALALLPTMTQNVLGYPVATAGLVMAPRGIGGMISFFVAGRLVGRIDHRILIVTGLLLFSSAFARMSHFSLQMDATDLAWTGFSQGLGTGLVFTPLSVLSYATLDPRLRTHGTGVFALMRSLGQASGVSIMQLLLVRNIQTVHARLTEGVRPDNPLAHAPWLAPPFSLSNPVGMAALNGEVTRQASMVAYVDMFHLMSYGAVLVIPLVLLMKKPGAQAIKTMDVIEEV